MKSERHKLSKSQNLSLRSQESTEQTTQNEEEVDLYNSQGLQSGQMERNNLSSYWEDLVRLLQLSVVLVLVIFISVMAYLIFVEVHNFQFSNSKDILQKTEKAKLAELHQPNQKDINNRHQQDQIDPQTQNLQRQMEQALKGDEHDPLHPSNHLSGQKKIEKQNEKNLQAPFVQVQTNKNTLQSQKEQVYDPVLIQLNRYRERFGPSYKETIYTMKNTSITQAQYLRAKNLIELTEFYNPKQKKFLVKEDTQNGNCGSDDPQCQKKQKYIDSIVAQEILYYEQKYQDSFKSLKQELPFCIIVPSYKNNHAKSIKRNLNSIFQQQFDNFHVVYIDDASKDGTPQVVRDYAQKYQINESKLLFIQNLQNQKALKNIYTAAHENCKQKQIMIIVDGDDYLIGTQVLRFLNFEYQTKNLLASYTNYLRINQPYYIKVGTSTPYQKPMMYHRAFRRTPKMFRASHLRSYYVDLFRKIKPEDLKDEKGEFFTAANDFAIMMPVLQMAAPHVEYLPELTYLYDSGTGLNNFQSKKQVQERNVKIVSKRKIYDQVNWQQFYPKN